MFNENNNEYANDPDNFYSVAWKFLSMSQVFDSL